MTTSGDVPCERCQSAAAADAAIRGFVAGRTEWTPEALAELAGLWAAWREAARREEMLAAA